VETDPGIGMRLSPKKKTGSQITSDLRLPIYLLVIPLGLESAFTTNCKSARKAILK
jgi:hypothetical protein